MYGVTYVALSNTVIGYYTISNSTIPRIGLPESILKGQPKYNDIPAILLARFAVDKSVMGRGIGHALMSHCLDLALYVSGFTGARYLITDAYETAKGWYERYNFQALIGSSSLVTTKMYVDLKVVRDAKFEKIANA
jgi:GNAT superfamily N-acetyltransferase